MTPSEFVVSLEKMDLPSVFNPWSDQCAVHDKENASATRRENLRLTIEAAIGNGAETMWVARDLGYRGGRRTGIPLTDDVHLDKASTLLGGINLKRATIGPVVAERTAAVIWRVLSTIDQPVMLWNVFPFHPHQEDDAFSNRCHTKNERDATWSVLEALIDLIKPLRIVTIGRDASIALEALGAEICPVRHPSYGGQREFIEGINAIYQID